MPGKKLEKPHYRITKNSSVLFYFFFTPVNARTVVQIMERIGNHNKKLSS